MSEFLRCRDCKHDKGKCVGSSRRGGHKNRFEPREMTNADRIRRMTELHFKKTDGFYMKCSENCCKEDFSCEDCKEFEKLVDRIGAIENILGDEYDLDRLREFVEADREGRCVVLPCKIGASVWRLYDDCDLPGDCYTKQKCKGCEYRNLFIEEQAFCLSMLSQNGELDPPYYTTHAEAEAALRREQDG